MYYNIKVSKCIIYYWYIFANITDNDVQKNIIFTNIIFNTCMRATWYFFFYFNYIINNTNPFKLTISNCCPCHLLWEKYDYNTKCIELSYYYIMYCIMYNKCHYIYYYIRFLYIYIKNIYSNLKSTKTLIRIRWESRGKCQGA